MAADQGGHGRPRDAPALARWLLAATVVSFLLVLLRDGLGVGFPLWDAGWAKTYNLTELLGVAVCALRTVRATGRERAAWLALTLGLLGFFAADVYYTAVIAPMEGEAPFPSPADAGYLSIYRGRTSRWSCCCAPAPAASP